MHQRVSLYEISSHKMIETCIRMCSQVIFLWEWKGNTSSDELDGHYFASALYYDLVAEEADKTRVRGFIKRITDHLIEHDLYLVDLDGKPTRWGVWNPEQLNGGKSLHGLEDEDWKEERGLNSLEILSHLKTAYHLTGEKRYQEKYLELIEKHGYAKNALTENVVDAEDLNHSDVQLAFLAYYPLLKYESDPELAGLYRKSLEKIWKIVKPERNPWWNFTVCVFMEGGCAGEDSIQTLRELPWEQFNWRMENSRRTEIPLDPRYQKEGARESREALPYDRISILRWNGNPYLLDSGGKGEIEGDGVIYLLPYWMGRHHGFIR